MVGSSAARYIDPMKITRRLAPPLALATLLLAPALPGDDAEGDGRIAAALQAAPEEMRDGATVIAAGDDGSTTVLRQGDNGLVCLADDPGDDAFAVACYHESLEPYMRRGRELAAEGVGGQERMTRRWEEAERGELEMPRAPATLYALTGSGFDPDTGEVADRFLRWVVYVPGATTESTGLSSSPSADEPWLMFPGTPGAHIMITPPRE